MTNTDSLTKYAVRLDGIKKQYKLDLARIIRSHDFKEEDGVKLYMSTLDVASKVLAEELNDENIEHCRFDVNKENEVAADAMYKMDEVMRRLPKKYSVKMKVVHDEIIQDALLAQHKQNIIDRVYYPWKRKQRAK